MAPDAYVGTAQAQQVLEQTLPEPMGPPQPSGTYHVDENVIIKLPKPGTRIVHALNYGESLWGKTAKIIAELPSGEIVNYFLKVVTLGDTGRVMCHGEYESLREIHKVTPDFVPEPYSWGSLATAPETYFLLTQFRDVGEQVRGIQISYQLRHLFIRIIV